jgi:YjbE family integral membrane protein
MSNIFDGLYANIQPQFWMAVVEIIWINVLLSGDNAIVIALACRSLPPKQRLVGMVLGTAVALLMRLVFASIVSTVIAIPYLKIVAGMALLWIATKLLVPANDTGATAASTKSLLQAVKAIAIADVVMSFDNVIAVVAAADGSFALLVFGLGISVPAIVAGATIIMAMLNYFPFIVWLGAALLGWIAGDVIATDPIIVEYVGSLGAEVQGVIRLSWPIAAAMGTLLGGLFLRARQARHFESGQLPGR